MNFYSGPKMQFLKTRIFPYPNKMQINTGKTKSIYLLNLHFSYILGSHIIPSLIYFDTGKIIEDKINKSNDPIFKIRENSQIWK